MAEETERRPIFAIEAQIEGDQFRGLSVCAENGTGYEFHVLAAADLCDFLKSNSEALFVTSEAAGLHWQIIELLHERSDRWWQLVTNYRLHDVGLLYQLVMYAKEGSFTQRPAREKIAKLCRINAQDPNVATLDLLLQCYRKLLGDVDLLKGEVVNEDPSPFASPSDSPFNEEPYGPLAVGLDTNADIALYPMGKRGVGIELNGRRDAQERAVSLLADLEKANNEARGLRSALLLVSETGSECLKQQERDAAKHLTTEWLQEVGNQIRPFADVPLPLPYQRVGKKRKLSLDPVRWFHQALHNESIDVWRLASQAAQFAELLRDSPRQLTVRLRWDIAPQLCARDPSAESIRKHGRGLLRPSEKKRFCVVTIADLSVRCLATVLRQRLQSEWLYILFAKGDSPYDELGESFRNWIQSESEESNNAANGDSETHAEVPARTRSRELQASDRNYFVYLASQDLGWSEIVRELLNAIAEGSVGKAALLTRLRQLGSPLVADSNGNTANNGEMLSNVELLLQWFTQDIVTGLDQMLPWPDLIYPEHKLGVEEGVLYQEVKNCLEPTEKDSDPFQDVHHAAIHFRRDLESENPNRSLLRFMIEQADLGGASRDEAIRKLRDKMLNRRHFSHYGRIGAPLADVYFNLRLVSQLRDDVIKRSSFALVRNGFELVALTSREFVIEAPLNSNEDVQERRLSNCLHDALSSLLGHAANNLIKVTYVDKF